ncbi:MAG: hypothetical protein A2Y78_08665 [Acidobacteria bacterium RBG_13_68_16]|nr:MAG: hypothetical protein A2Y78_08665 [Acidobacteria bacterium RBG_13_68_16]
MKTCNVVRVLVSLVLVAGFNSSLAAQDFRGSISGTVKDESGGVLPGASVTVTNTSTNIATALTTNDRGFYQARYLISGTYSVEASLDGFQTVVRSGIEVRVGDSVSLDIVLNLGRKTEVLEITASTPYLDTTSTATGQVIDRQQIAQLPLADGTAYMLTRLAPGILETSDLHFARPMDNANLGGFIANGAKGGNDFTIDGAPNVVSWQQVNYGGERIGFSPPSDAIAEFRVNTLDLDAQQGHTAGANVNLALKSGGNKFHGSGSYFNRSDSRSKNSIFSERSNTALPPRDYDREVVVLSGPIFKDKTFFMVSGEKLYDVTAEPVTYTVPTEKMRHGDFSELLASGIKIYDPLTGTTNRTAFTDNIIPADRLNPIALKLLSYYPLPNQAGKADGSNNYFSNMGRTYDYKAALIRLDHNFTVNQKLAVTGYWNTRQEDRYDWAGEQNGFQVTAGFDNRSNLGGTATYTNMFTSNLIGDLRLSSSKFGEWREPAESFDPVSLGFDAATVALFRGYQYLPRFDIAGGGVTYQTLGSQRSDYSEGRDNPFYNTSFASTLTWALSDHTIRAGYDLRIQKWTLQNYGNMAGRYNFTGAYTRANNSAAIQAGQALAQFLLGIPTSGGNSNIDNNTSGRFQQTYHSLFAHDTWSPISRLTVNFGLRAELDSGLTETHNRNATGFDLTAISPLNAAARAAYAKNPIDEIPADQFQVLGGLVYKGRPIYKSLLSVLPRVGASYQIDRKTVVRGGIGLYSYPYTFDSINQAGYSQQTLLVSTNDSGKTFIADLNDPFPNGLDVPPGSSQGLLTWAGRDLVADAVTMIVNSERKTPVYTRWQLGAQRDLGAGWVVQLDYIGSQGRNLPVRRDLNGLPKEYVSFNAERDTAQETYLTTNVTNPFKGLLPGTTLNGSTIQRQQLLLAYPEFLRVAVMQYNGSDSYNSGQLSLSKRFENGLSVIASYTRSKMTERVSYLNSFDTKLESRTTADDRPNRASVGATVPVPVGKGRKWGDKWGSVMQTIFGDWNVSVSYQYQDGFPLTSFTSGIATGWGHIYFDPTCNAKDLSVGSVGSRNSAGKIIGLDVPAWDTRCFYFHDSKVQTNGVDDPAKQRADTRIAVGTANARYFPTILANMRMPNLHLMDIGISKTFDLPGTVQLLIRLDAINAINYTVYWDPDLNPRSATFGTFRSQRNNPRDIQLGARLTF